ncbi:MAG: tRNA pseudouridine(13) synthase TruD [Aquificota bacterium]|nr:tRNA pseudouridine(13) synthase TruD [Aquificota bacterium]
MARIKDSPEDFFVKEIRTLDLKDSGEFAYFLLRKKNMTTNEAVREVSKILGVKPSDIGYAGLKDKRAVTEQYLSVKRPRRVREVEDENLSLRFLGYGDRPIRLGDLEGNYFRIRVLLTSRRERARLEEGFDLVKRFGFENYFGEQRFGSVKHAEEFIIKHLIRHDYESAMREYLTSLGDRRLKKQLLKAWRDWDRFLELMPKGSHYEVEVVKALRRGVSFKRAFLILPASVRLMFSFAYQSYLWNRYLTTFVVRYFPHCSVPFLKWRLAFITRIDESVFEEIKHLEIPFLGREVKPENPKVDLIIRDVLEDEGLTPGVLKAERIGMRIFTDGVRKAFVFPRDLTLEEVGDKYAVLSFVLPPGSYATVLIRKILCSPLDM